jgi:hypothetical protein
MSGQNAAALAGAESSMHSIYLGFRFNTEVAGLPALSQKILLLPSSGLFRVHSLERRCTEAEMGNAS